MQVGAPVISPANSPDPFWRSLQTLTVTRAVIAGVLLVYLTVNVRHNFWSTGPLNYRVTGLLYLLLSIGFMLLALYYRRRFWWQLTSQIALDIVAISLLYIAGGGAKSGLAILYLFPLAGAGTLASLLMALFFVSVVALFLLAESSYQ